MYAVSIAAEEPHSCEPRPDCEWVTSVRGELQVQLLHSLDCSTRRHGRHFAEQNQSSRPGTTIVLSADVFNSCNI